MVVRRTANDSDHGPRVARGASTDCVEAAGFVFATDAFCPQ